jgi:uncharacterized protein
MSKELAALIGPQTLGETSSLTGVQAIQVAQVLKLLYEEECTVPFITRYRKERTGGLNEEDIRKIQESFEGIIEREKRREYILKTIGEMGKLTPELEKQIKAATTQNVLEDIYAPYKSKKKTKGQLAEEAGLLPLAELLLEGKFTTAQLEARGSEWISGDKGIADWAAALEGAGHIVMEKISHDVETKNILRDLYWKEATLVSEKRKDAESIKEFDKFKDYFEFSNPIKDLKNPKIAHRFLAMRRGMTLKILKVDVAFDSETAFKVIAKKFIPENAKTSELLGTFAKKAYSNSIHPSLDLEVKTELKGLSDDSAIDVFKVNLKNLLLQPYLGPKAVIGVDPGIRTGCKIAIVDDTGKFLFDTVIYPHPPQQDVKGSQTILERLIDHFKVEHLAVGNGTFGRETLQFLQKNIPQIKDGKAHATLVNEAGASIYSASEIAAKEFPDKDATVRGAISIARRFQDPLAELVKIDPKSIGVGQYQHDLNQVKLKRSLEGVVEGCVNFVGVDLNTASAPLLSYVSGIGAGLAENIVKTRGEKGAFKNRQELLKVTRFSSKIFEQSAGFLRIYNGENPLDATFIHPERYQLISDWAKGKGLSVADLLASSEKLTELENDKSLKETLGGFTFDDVIKALKAPKQDPRTEFKSTAFRDDISSIKDLVAGQWYPGIVNNITQFGAFVDIGVKESGLVHVSQIADRYVDNALEVLKVGQEVLARVIEVDLGRGRISLSLRKTEQGARAFSASEFASSGNKGNSQRPQKAQPDAPLKNNAFAALKGLKLK